MSEIGAFAGSRATQQDVMAAVTADGAWLTEAACLRLMLPAAIPPAIELIARFGKRPSALTDWLGVVAPGADLSGLASRTLIWAIEKAGEEAPRGEARAVIELHRLVIAGERPARAQWSEARRAAVIATEHSDPASHYAHAMVEAAAWHPDSAASVLYDTLLPWLIHVSRRTLKEAGWGDSESAQVREIVQRSLAADPDGDPYRLVRGEAPDLFRQMEDAGAADALASAQAADEAFTALLFLTRENEPVS